MSDQGEMKSMSSKKRTIMLFKLTLVVSSVLRRERLQHCEERRFVALHILLLGKARRRFLPPAFDVSISPILDVCRRGTGSARRPEGQKPR